MTLNIGKERTSVSGQKGHYVCQAKHGYIWVCEKIATIH